MPIPWESMLLISLLAMVIPVAILIGLHWRSGPLISLSAGATLGVGSYLALMWEGLWTDPTDTYFYYPIALPVVIGGVVALLGALALAFIDALRARRRILALTLCVAVYATFVGMLGFIESPLRVCGDALPPTCGPPDLGRFALFAALSLAGPLATLIYALFAAFQRQPRALPDGLVVSRLTGEEG